MKVADLPRFGAPNVIVPAIKPEPTLGPRDVLIQVAAAGVNRADVLQRQGRYPPPPGAPPWLGLEVSGEIVAIGQDAPRWRVGDAVCALLPGGGYAERVCVDASLVLAAPTGLDLVHASALPEAACTVWSNFTAARAAPGELILIHGGSGGIGSLAIQIAKAAGLRVLATAGTSDKVARCLTLGADIAVDYHEDWVAAALDLGGADVVLDVVGAAYLESNLTALATDGRLVVIGLQRGAKAELDLGALLARRVSVIGTTLRSRPLMQRAAIVNAVEEDVWPWIPDSVLPLIHGIYPLEEAAAAHEELESGHVQGKLLLTP